MGKCRREEEGDKRRKQVFEWQVVAAAAAAFAAAVWHPETTAEAARCSPAKVSAVPCNHNHSLSVRLAVKM
jgi:hypothetical protein